jgi:large conductance mechanosensitive channel
MAGFVSDFKAFIMKGNIVDLATAVIIGGAFGKIVTSFVNDILMPLIGTVLGKVNFRELKFVLKEAIKEGDKVITEAVTLNYGQFIQNVVDFVIIAFCIFLIIKSMAAMKKKEAAAPAPAPEPPKPSKQEELLAEIRDLLKNKQA